MSVPAPASFESKCPSCQKQFANDSLVLRHMNNPRMSCASWSNFLESISPGPPNHPASYHTVPNSRDDEANGDDSTTDHQTSTAMYYEEIHPNIPSVFRSGPGFMDNFNADLYAEKRGENLYSQNCLIAWHLFPENPMHLYNYATALCYYLSHIVTSSKM